MKRRSRLVPLTVRQLLQILSTEDPDKIAVLNLGRQLAVITSVSGTMAFDPKTGEVGITELTTQAARLGFTEEDVIPKGKPAVIFSAHHSTS